MNTTLSIDDLIGRKVLTGSPGYRDLEIIESIKVSDAWKDGDRILIKFESGFSTNMSPGDFEYFLAAKEAEYVRWFRSKADNALETIALAQPFL